MLILKRIVAVAKCRRNAWMWRWSHIRRWYKSSEKYFIDKKFENYFRL